MPALAVSATVSHDAQPVDVFTVAVDFGLTVPYADTGRVDHSSFQPVVPTRLSVADARPVPRHRGRRSRPLRRDNASDGTDLGPDTSADRTKILGLNPSKDALRAEYDSGAEVGADSRVQQAAWIKPTVARTMPVGARFRS
jgi:hypothetical protein